MRQFLSISDSVKPASKYIKLLLIHVIKVLFAVLLANHALGGEIRTEDSSKGGDGTHENVFSILSLRVFATDDRRP